MRVITADRPRNRPVDLRPHLLLACLLMVAPAGEAVPPVDPLPVPDYSFDLLSCAVDGGIVEAGDVLTLNFPDPNVLVFGSMLGLMSSDDDLDALSAANASVSPEETFALLFSVDALSAGVAPPDPALIQQHVPYNVADQAERGHAAGDQFMSTLLFTRSGGVGGSFSNNVLIRNNYDEGGTDFSAQPPTAAYQLAQDDSLDVVDATAQLTRDGEFVVDVYFSVTADSPSLDTLPSYGIPSGADIYFNENPPAYAPTGLYAAHWQMQLDEADDIDALTVFDTNENASFDESDQVLFSLAPGSPSLATIPGASQDGAAADVFMVTYGQAPWVFATAADLGLGDPQDNLNALDFCSCEDSLFCAAQHGIRSPLGDLDYDGDVDLDDLSQLLGNYGMTNGAAYVDGDLDGDGDVDLSDLAQLLGAYGTVCD